MVNGYDLAQHEQLPSPKTRGGGLLAWRVNGSVQPRKGNHLSSVHSDQRTSLARKPSPFRRFGILTPLEVTHFEREMRLKRIPCGNSL